METTEHGLKKPASSDFYNIDDFNANADITEEHLSDIESHVNASEIIGITEPTTLTAIATGDTNDTLWGKIKKAISVLIAHIGTVATGSVLGHIKIGTGLQMLSGVASVKLTDSLTTTDSTTAASATAVKTLNTNLVQVSQREYITPALSAGETTITLSLPSGTILGIAQSGWQPGVSWDTKLYIKNNTNLASGICDVYVEGSRTQVYAIRYTVFYKH
ncbi:MAG: hypothetical protein ACERKZ_05615 [Lachnotalea sp.]